MQGIGLKIKSLIYESTLDNLFIMALPPGVTEKEGIGMSGSPVFDERNALCGITMMTTTIRVGKTTKTALLFHGIDSVRKAQKNPPIPVASVR